MTGFMLTAEHGQKIRFHYLDDAPVTSAAFHALLPFTKIFFHARVSGQEIWTDHAPVLNIIQENASVFAEPGEVVFGPAKPSRVKTAGCMGIYYGEGKGLDAASIFAKVFPEDAAKLKELGEWIWKKGAQQLVFSSL